MSELEDLRDLIGTGKSIRRTKSIREELIIAEHGEPSPSLIGIAEALKSLPTPKYAIGDLVVVPPAVYGVVQFHLYEPSAFTWVYAIFLEENPSKIHYFPEKSLVLSKHKNEL